jgi:SAM-dependent methyltransferase
LHEVTSPGESLRVLDIGAGSGSMSRAVTSWFPRAVVVSLDYRLQHLASAPRLSVVADAFALPFTPRTFDIVFCSLFLHHFSDEGVTQLLQRFHAMAKRAVCVVDLHRSRVPYHFIPATAWLFRWHPITRHDGPASVLAAFSPIDLDRAAERAGFSDYSVCSHAPWFRLSLLARV